MKSDLVLVIILPYSKHCPWTRGHKASTAPGWAPGVAMVTSLMSPIRLQLHGPHLLFLIICVTFYFLMSSHIFLILYYLVTLMLILILLTVFILTFVTL